LYDIRNIFNLLDNFCNETNRHVNEEHSNFGLTINYHYNNGIILFTSYLSSELNFKFSFRNVETLRIFNVYQDPNDQCNSVFYILYHDDYNPIV
jgi:hypothetical protein